MAWEKYSRHSILVPAILSVLWVAVVITGARFTDFNEPYLPFAIAGAAAFFFRARLSRWEIYTWLFSSALLVKVIHLPQVPFFVLRVAASMSLLGFGAMLLLGLRFLWSEEEDRSNALALLAPALILMLFIFATARVLSLSGAANPQTYDAWLYAFDGSLGFQPSFAVGRIMYDSIVLTGSSLLTYLALPFAMAVVCAWQIPRGARRISWYMLIVLLLAGVGGWLLYYILPGTGPIYAFTQDFPWKNLSYHELSTFALRKMTVPTTIPRNAMPSLHVGWALLLCWNSRRFPVVLRAALLVFLAVTVFATLGSGQHYLVDLVVSLPFALTVQALASYALPKKVKPGRSPRLAAIFTGAALTLAWLLLVRFGLPLALLSRFIPWTLIVVTISVTLWLQHRISRRGSDEVEYSRDGSSDAEEDSLLSVS
jgi:hypothetical protein